MERTLAMNGKGRKYKGAQAERELGNILSAELGQDISRNLEQPRSGGADLLGVGPFAIEVKRLEFLAVKAYWHQAVKQADAAGKLPALAYRKNRKLWRIRIRIADFIPTFHSSVDVNDGVAIKNEHPLMLVF
jgi:Holliday junction resolvase